jgi:copper transport protein
VLAGKLALVLGIAMLAGWNRWRLTPALARDAVATAPRLARSVALELGLAALVLAAAGLWRFTPPPRTVVPRPPLSLHIHDPRAMATLTLAPGRAGANDVAVVLQAASFAPLPAKQVTLAFARPEAGIAPIERRASLLPDGTWRTKALPLPVAGAWQVRLDLLIDDFDQVTLEDSIEIAP